MSTPLGRESFGAYEAARPTGDVLWAHIGPKLGDLGVLSDLLGRIAQERSDISLVVTYDADERPKGSDQILVHAPDDKLPSVRRFLEYWKPDVALWTGLDFRPALIAETAARGVPLILAETKGALPTPGGVSRGVLADLLELFQAILVGDRRSATAIRQQGAPMSRVESIGHLQQGGATTQCNQTERDDLAAMIGGRPTWFAASVAEAELEAVIAAHKAGQRRTHRLLLLLEPQDPASGADWTARLRSCSPFQYVAPRSCRAEAAIGGPAATGQI